MVSVTADGCAEPDLVACLRFEDDSMDSSGNNNHATATDVVYTMGTAGKALTLDGASLVTIAPDPSFALMTVTMELWVRLAAQPAAGARMGVIDHNSRYSIFYYENGGLRCLAEPEPLWADITLPTGQWTHIACVATPTSQTAYVDGAVVASAAITTPMVGTLSGDLIHIGSNATPGNDNLIGAMDELRIFNVARTAQQICDAAGGNGC